MPFVIGAWRRGGGLIAALAGVLALAAPAAAPAAELGNPTACTPQAQSFQIFSAFGDDALYTLAPGGDMEGDASGWTLLGGAEVVDGNQPFDIGAPGAASLALPAGSSAVSAPMCIDATYPHFRLFARNLGSPDAALRIDVLFLDGSGRIRAKKRSTHRSATGVWEPTQAIDIGLFADDTAVEAAPVAFRFTPKGRHGAWQIDDVYVDPWNRG